MCNLRLAIVCQSKERTAGEFHLRYPLFLHPEGVAWKNQGVDGRETPIVVGISLDDRPADFYADARMHGRRRLLRARPP